MLKLENKEKVMKEVQGLKVFYKKKNRTMSSMSIFLQKQNFKMNKVTCINIKEL